MIIGVDVGGTYTDAVAVDQGTVIASLKVPTGSEIIKSLSEALEQLMQKTAPSDWQRLVISTTMLTNIVAQERLEKTALVLIPGPGVNPETLALPGDRVILSGAVNFRGQIIQEMDEDEIKTKIETLYRKGFRQMAVVGKFSGRNRALETQAAQIIAGMHPDVSITLGHRSSGFLNFPRRAVTAWLLAATGSAYGSFTGQLQQVISRFQLNCPVFIMKADGGVLPLEAAERFAADTVYSGPAASTMGALSLLAPDQSAVVMDVGGSTTDLSLILNGVPLLASRGLKINGYLTQTKGLAMHPVPLGGDAPLAFEDGRLQLLKKRRGQAACFGGDTATLTDALNIAAGIPGCNIADSCRALEKISPPADLDALAGQAVDAAAEKIAGEINRMIGEWQSEPAYHVWEVLQKGAAFPDLLVGIGGGAAGLTERVAKKLGMKHLLPHHAPVANAVGCAVAKPTMSLGLHLDTGRKMLTLDDGSQEAFTGSASEEKGISLAKGFLAKRLASIGINIQDSEIETLYSELFQVIRGYSRTGQIIDVEVQVKPGLVTRIVSH